MIIALVGALSCVLGIGEAKQNGPCLPDAHKSVGTQSISITEWHREQMPWQYSYKSNTYLRRSMYCCFNNMMDTLGMKGSRNILFNHHFLISGVRPGDELSSFYPVDKNREWKLRYTLTNAYIHLTDTSLNANTKKVGNQFPEAQRWAIREINKILWINDQSQLLHVVTQIILCNNNSSHLFSEWEWQKKTPANHKRELTSTWQLTTFKGINQSRVCPR